MESKEVENEINKILSTNKVSDLKRFLRTRRCLNCLNGVSVYLFHVVQASGILCTSVATSYNMNSMVWVGIGLTACASLISVMEKTSNSISLKILKDIKSIKAGTYVDEGLLVEPDEAKQTIASKQNSASKETTPVTELPDVENQVKPDTSKKKNLVKK